jgi:hypothetical protein
LVFVVFCFLFPFFFLAGPPSSHCYKFTSRERERERGNIGSSAERRAHHQFC